MVYLFESALGLPSPRDGVHWERIPQGMGDEQVYQDHMMDLRMRTIQGPLLVEDTSPCEAKALFVVVPRALAVSGSEIKLRR